MLLNGGISTLELTRKLYIYRLSFVLLMLGRWNFNAFNNVGSFFMVTGNLGQLADLFSTFETVRNLFGVLKFYIYYENFN